MTNREKTGENKTFPAAESFFLAALLAAAGGYMDAYTYLVRGKVFANAQTGNMVLLGIKVMDGKILETAKYLIPIIAFVVGIIVAEFIQNRYKGLEHGDWRQITLVIEIVAIAVAAVLPIGSMDMAANTLMSFISAIQMGSFRHVRGNAFVSTMCTGNLRNGTECLYRHLFRGNKAMKSKWMLYYGVILFFIIGAGVGAYAIAKFGKYSVLGCCVLLFFGIMKLGKGAAAPAA